MYVPDIRLLTLRYALTCAHTRMSHCPLIPSLTVDVACLYLTNVRPSLDPHCNGSEAFMPPRVRHLAECQSLASPTQHQPTAFLQLPCRRATLPASPASSAVIRLCCPYPTPPTPQVLGIAVANHA